MKKMFVLAAVAAMVMSCSKEAGDVSDNMVTVGVTLSGFDVSTEPMTRAEVGDFCTRLDVWISDGDAVTEVHQQSTDTGFGSFTLALNRSKTYTLNAVAHKASGQATLADGVISFPDDKVTHTVFVSHTFTPTDGMTIALTMRRIVAQFSLTTTDQVPDDVTKMTFTISDVYNRWNVSTGGANKIDRTSTFENLIRKDDGTIGFNIYAIVTDAETLHTVTVTAYDVNNNVKQQRTFTDVPLRNGYKTIARGNFFTNATATVSLTVGDWQEYDVITF